MFQSSSCTKYYVRWEHYHWCLALRGVGCRHNSFRKLIVSARHGGTTACVENLFAASPLVLACFPLQFVVFFVLVFVVFVQLWSCPCFPPRLVVTCTKFKDYVCACYLEYISFEYNLHCTAVRRHCTDWYEI